MTPFSASPVLGAFCLGPWSGPIPGLLVHFGAGVPKDNLSGDAILGLCLKPLAAIILPGSENRTLVGVDHHYARRKTKRPFYAIGRCERVGLCDVFNADGKFGRHAVRTRGDSGHTQNQTYRYAQ